jgi:hypothetical protein
MSDKAAEELSLLLVCHGHEEISEPDGFGPIVAVTVSGFLNSAYFAKSAWFRRQAVHRTTTVSINKVGEDDGPSVLPIFHLMKTKRGHEVVSCDEAPLSESYYEERLIEEVKVETGIPA